MKRTSKSLDGIELKFLIFFDELFRTQNLTRTAQLLGQAQPTLSEWLKKLRLAFGDPLFVRVSDGMAPTEYARQLHLPIHSALEMLKAATSSKAAFEPATSTRTFKICMTDASHVVLLPTLLKQLQNTAKNICIEALPITPYTPQLLEQGEADLAIGYIPILQAGSFQQAVFMESWVCVVGSSHPRIIDQLTQSQYSSERHVNINVSGSGHISLEVMLKT